MWNYGTLNKTIKICDAAQFHLERWGDIKIYYLPLLERKAHDMISKVHLERKESKGRGCPLIHIRWIYYTGSRQQNYASLYEGLHPYWTKWKAWQQYRHFIRLRETVSECQQHKHIITCTWHDYNMLQWENREEKWFPLKWPKILLYWGDVLGSTREFKRMLFHKNNSDLKDDGVQIISHQSMWQIFSKAQFTNVYYRVVYCRMVNTYFYVLIKLK